jgi:beta-glucosidase
MSRVNDAVRGILKVKKKMGLFETRLNDPKLYDKFGSEEFANESFKAALESITLLKNKNNILPLDKNKKVLVTGVAANSLNYINGAWSRTWGGEDTSFNDVGKKTILQAISDKIGKSNVLFTNGTSYTEDIDTKRTARIAKDADYVLVCLGEKPATEKPSDINELDLPEVQLNLVKEIAKAGKPIIVILVESRPRIIREIEPLTDGILMAYLPGNEGGRALAEIVFGDVNPSGKLPLTYPKYSGSIWAYDHKRSDERDAGFGFDAFDPQFEFGFGLSYTNFRFSNLKVSSDTIRNNDTLSISIDIENIGSRKGKEVIKLFLSDSVASISPAVKLLKRFEKIELEPSQKETVNFEITKNDLMFVDSKNQWVAEEGLFKLSINNLIHYFYLENTENKHVKNEK